MTSGRTKRDCAGCTLCCRLLAVDSLAKPALADCIHCTTEVGCQIYGQRPQDCRDYLCGYLRVAEVGEHWDPRRSKMVIQISDDPAKIIVHVDPKHSELWRTDPYYSDLKAWAVLALEHEARVYVVVQTATTIILPDRHVELGVLGDGDSIDLVSVPGPEGMRRFVYAKKTGEPAKGPRFWR
ncbi:MAG TPA: hypothetical protein VMQ11_13510 [Alphaproteobacteria bacterium]|nr:hypothetical protein [Alphaproteobacteria bacterium]